MPEKLRQRIAEAMGRGDFRALPSEVHVAYLSYSTRDTADNTVRVTLELNATMTEEQWAWLTR